MHFGFCQTDVLQHYHKTFTFHDTTTQSPVIKNQTFHSLYHPLAPVQSPSCPALTNKQKNMFSHIGHYFLKEMVSAVISTLFTL